MLQAAASCSLVPRLCANSRRFPSLAGRGAVCLRLQTRSLRASMSDSSNGNVRAGASSSPQREGGAGPAVAPPAAEGPSSTTDGKGRRKGNVDHYLGSAKTLPPGHKETGWLMDAQRKAQAERGSVKLAEGLKEDPFAELGMDWRVLEEAGAVRVRQHVNPLESRFQKPAGPLEWDKIFEDPSKPLVVDIGSGSGRFLLLMGKRWGGSHNYLGLEIREKLVERANRWAELIQLGGRVHFAFCNATISMRTLLGSYPGQLDLVTVQFPDPHFKRKHRKRRTIQQNTARDIVDLLRVGGRVFLQSDVEEIAIDMRDQFEALSEGRLELADEHGTAETFPAKQAAFYEGVRVELLREQMAKANQRKSKKRKVEQGEEGKGNKGEDGEGGEKAGGAGEGEGEGAEGGLEPEPTFASKWAEAGWLVVNPLGVPTEREVYTSQTGAFGGTAHRILIVKKRE